VKIAVVGTGYVGLVTGTCLAESGNQVVCVDIDQAKVDKMKAGEIPIYEPGLEEVFSRNISENRLSFSTNLGEGIEGAEIIFLALPTPPNEDGSADLSYVLGVAGELGPLLKKYTVIVDKSTVPVGTAVKVRQEVAKNAKVDFDIVSNPEFLREGLAVNDFMHPDRIVIGVTSDKARKLMKKLYDPFATDGGEIIFMDESSAELTKYAANSFLATKISFMNEIANLCDILGANVDDIRRGIGSDPRIGHKFLYSGIGYGGSCFPKDVSALFNTAKANDYDFKIIGAVNEVNNIQRKIITKKILEHFDGNIKGKTFGLWGLAFKPDTDDIREAPAIYIINELLKQGASISAYDPEATDNVKKLYADNDKIQFNSEPYQALDNADALIIATEWQEFKSPDFDVIKSKLKNPVIFDGRNLYDLKEMTDREFNYQSIGRAKVEQG
jgi:UDPglucose 6-dehydrogenase